MSRGDEKIQRRIPTIGLIIASAMLSTYLHRKPEPDLFANIILHQLWLGRMSAASLHGMGDVKPAARAGEYSALGGQIDTHRAAQRTHGCCLALVMHEMVDTNR